MGLQSLVLEFVQVLLLPPRAVGRHKAQLCRHGVQHCGVHVNQAFVGVAFFEPPRREFA